MPRLQAAGWQIVGRPGFAHESVPVPRWRLAIESTSDEPGRELAELGERGPTISALRQPYRESSWILSLGIEVDMLDSCPCWPTSSSETYVGSTRRDRGLAGRHDRAAAHTGRAPHRGAGCAAADLPAADEWQRCSAVIRVAEPNDSSASRT